MADVTSCPGTDTCNLGIASSTGMAKELEKTIAEEFPQFVTNKDIAIKISGCMNACGQHSIAQIGFYGMSIKNGKHVIPAFQVLLGGGNSGNGRGRFADKIIKIPSKRGPQALRLLIHDYERYQLLKEPFNHFYLRKGKDHFYQLLKPLADLSKADQDLMIDWGHDEAYIKAIGVGALALFASGFAAQAADKVYFYAEDNVIGQSIYETDGTTDNTLPALDMYPNTVGADPRQDGIDWDRC